MRLLQSKNNLMLPSLPKDQISEFLEGLLPDTRLLIEPKIDGVAIACLLYTSDAADE